MYIFRIYTSHFFTLNIYKLLLMIVNEFSEGIKRAFIRNNRFMEAETDLKKHEKEM